MKENIMSWTKSYHSERECQGKSIQDDNTYSWFKYSSDSCQGVMHLNLYSLFLYPRNWNQACCCMCMCQKIHSSTLGFFTHSKLAKVAWFLAGCTRENLSILPIFTLPLVALIFWISPQICNQVPLAVCV